MKCLTASFILKVTGHLWMLGQCACCCIMLISNYVLLPFTCAITATTKVLQWIDSVNYLITEIWRHIHWNRPASICTHGINLTFWYFEHILLMTLPHNSPLICLVNCHICVTFLLKYTLHKLIQQHWRPADSEMITARPSNLTSWTSLGGEERRFRAAPG